METPGSDISDTSRRAAQVGPLVARVRAMPAAAGRQPRSGVSVAAAPLAARGRAAAVEAARAALRSGEIDSQAAIAAAVRAIRLGR